MTTTAAPKHPAAPAPVDVPLLHRLTLDLRRREVQRDLDDAHGLHQRVMSLLPDDAGPQPRARYDVLHRVETTHAGTRLLVQATTDLDITRLPDGYAHDHASVDLTRLLPHLSDGARVRYSLTASATKRVAHGDLAGRRVALVSADDLQQWWSRRASAAGLTDDPAATSITPAPTVTGKRPGAKAAADRITHRAVRVEGAAVVADATALAAALRTGIGPGKPYGLGLLSVVPVRG